MTVDQWFAAQDAYWKACAAYNKRLLLIRAERERDNWSMNVEIEYRELHNAQRHAQAADRELYLAMGGKIEETESEDRQLAI